LHSIVTSLPDEGLDKGSKTSEGFCIIDRNIQELTGYKVGIKYNVLKGRAVFSNVISSGVYDKI